MNELPVINGWVVDFRLREFRRVIRVSKGFKLLTVSFDSEQGKELLYQIVYPPRKLL